MQIFFIDNNEVFAGRFCYYSINSRMSDELLVIINFRFWFCAKRKYNYNLHFALDKRV